MTEREALLRAVCESPDDDTPRLVFADWLDEHDEPERAEFIQVQVALQQFTGPSTAGSALMNRMHKLLRLNEQRWRAELPYSERFMWGRFDRGFVEDMRVFDLDLFRQVAPTVFGSVPLIQVEFVLPCDPGELADIPELSRVRHLGVRLHWPRAESVKRLAAAANLTSLEELAISGPTMDFALEDLLSEAFGSRLVRGM